MNLGNICIADRALALMLWLTCFGCGAADEPTKTGAKEQSKKQSNHDGGSVDGDVNITAPTRADPPGEVDRSTARAGCETPPTASASDTVTLTLPVIDSLQLTPVADVAIAACDFSDHECTKPVASAISNKDGKATLKVPAKLTGYLQQTENSDYVAALYFTPGRWPADGVLSNLPLVPSAAFRGLALALGTSLDSKRGHAMLIVEDCTGAALSGISFSSPQADATSVRFYVRDQIPSISANETSPAGDGGYVNLPAGTVDITATDTKTGLVLNTVKALIRAESTTTVYIRPSARGS